LPPLPFAACATCLALLMAAFLMSLLFILSSCGYPRHAHGCDTKGVWRSNARKAGGCAHGAAAAAAEDRDETRTRVRRGGECRSGGGAVGGGLGVGGARCARPERATRGNFGCGICKTVLDEDDGGLAMCWSLCLRCGRDAQFNCCETAANRKPCFVGPTPATLPPDWVPRNDSGTLLTAADL
jgi:hypothetical protein